MPGFFAVSRLDSTGAIRPTEVPELLDTLAAAQAANGDFDQAAKTLERALALAPGGSAARYIGEFRERLALYRSGKAFVDGH